MTPRQLYQAALSVALFLCLCVGLPSLAVYGLLWEAPSAEAGELEECQRLAPKYAARAEVRLQDGTRCDLLSAEYAIEVDYCHKHYEAVGQATWYSILTGKKPAVLLLSKGKADARHIERSRQICERLGITLFVERLP